ncbi:hypothetical protein HKX48_004042 [Thoreauomyces humboldtii]|nr:hypothetical protein HKX48_004042 [Thoreauomyces humboldtii]
MGKLAPEGFEDGRDPGMQQRRPSVGAVKKGTAGGKNPLWKDAGNIVLLIALYMLQGVPLGLSFGAIPFLLKSKLSYKDIALFSLSSYPYSLKLLWSPIVDSIYLKTIGRRKSWIVPIQAITGLALLGLGLRIESVLAQDTLPVVTLAVTFTILVFLCATQDIAVDGWALTLLRDENKQFASTAQTIGLNTGYFLSFTVFLALNSPEFCNKYLRSTPMELGVLALGSYLKFWGVMFLICNAWLIFVKKELADQTETIDDIKIVYQTIWQVIKMPHMKKLTGLLLVAKIGFIANEAVTPLKLLDKGLKKEDMALSVLIDFPFQLFFGYYAAKWSSGKQPLRPWLYAFYGRLGFAALGMLLVRYFPEGGASGGYFFVVMAATVLNSFMSTVQFVGMGSFFTKISDPLIGGTYMTLLNTLSNLGGTWPRFFVLEAVDHFTHSHCEANTKDPSDPKWGVLAACSTDAQKAACKEIGGTCIVDRDGYYVVGTACVAVGLLTLLLYVRPMVSRNLVMHLSTSHFLASCLVLASLAAAGPLGARSVANQIPGQDPLYSDNRGVADIYPATNRDAILPTEKGAPGPDDNLFQNLLAAEWQIYEFYQQGVERFNQSDFTALGFPDTTYERIQTIRDNEAGHLVIFQDAITNTSIKPGPCQYDFGFGTSAELWLYTLTTLEVGAKAFLTGLVLQASQNASKAALVAIAETETRHETWSLIDIWKNDPFVGPVDTIYPFANQLLDVTADFVIPGTCPSANPPYPSPSQHLPKLVHTGPNAAIPGNKITIDYANASHVPVYKPGQQYWANFYHALSTISVPFDPIVRNVTVPTAFETKGAILINIADQEGAPTAESVVAGPLLVVVQLLALTAPEKVPVNAQSITAPASSGAGTVGASLVFAFTAAVGALLLA